MLFHRSAFRSILACAILSLVSLCDIGLDATWAQQRGASPTPRPRTTPQARPPAAQAQTSPAPGATPAPGVPGRPVRTPPARAGQARRGPAQDPRSSSSIVPPIENRVVESFNVPTPAPPEPLTTVEKDLPKMTINAIQQPIERIFETINEEVGTVVKAMEKVRGEKVDLRARDMNVEEILKEIALGKNWTWVRREDGTYEVWDQESYIKQEMQKLVVRTTIPVRYLDASEVMNSIQELKSDVGQLAVNARTNEIIVTDIPDKIALMQSIVRELDVQLFTQIFYVKYIDFDEVRERFTEMTSPAGQIHLDPMNHRMIVTDSFQKLKEMEQLLEILDIDQPMKLYHMNNIGLDGADVQELIESFLEPIVTPDGILIFYETLGVLVVKDTADVHTRIEEILMALDRTPKQIWIEGEILEVRHDYSFDLGTELTFDRDLADAFDPPDTPAISLPRVTAGGGGLTVFNLMGNVQAQLNAVMKDDDTRLVLQPRALVRNLEEVLIDLTQENPQITTFFSQNQGGFNSGFNSSSITFVPTGLRLRILPTISNRGLIEMEIDFENSTPIFTELSTGSGGNQSAVGRNTQHLQTVLIIPSGETRVLGGFVSLNDMNGSSGVPFLSKIPLLGALFGSRTQSKNKRNLVFFLTPTIVEERPQVEFLVDPINAAAYALSRETVQVLDQPAALNPIPSDLLPYLLMDQPRGEEAAEKPGAPGPSAQVTPRPLPRLDVPEGFLTNEPYQTAAPPSVGRPGEYGPALELLSQDRTTVGLSGVILGGSGGSGRRVAPPPRQGAARRQPAQAAQPTGRTQAAGAGATQTQPAGRPTPTPTPAQATAQPRQTPQPTPAASQRRSRLRSTPTPVPGEFRP